MDFRHSRNPIVGRGPGGSTASLLGSGVSIADYNGDGLPDIYFAGSPGALYRNLGNWKFEDATARAGLARSADEEGRAGVFGDYNNDGCPDLYLTFVFSPNRLYRNDCDGTFTDVTDRAGVGYNGTTHSAVWGDYDRDGWLDLYLANYADWRRPAPENLNDYDARMGERNILFRNNGDGTFTDVTEPAGVGDTRYSLAALFSDLNGDMWPDIYVANDFGRNTLYLNQGNGRFRDATVEAGVGYRGNGMSADSADYDGDLRPDIYVTNIVWLRAVAEDLGLTNRSIESVRELLAERIRRGGSAPSFLYGGVPHDAEIALNSGSALYRANPGETWSEVARGAEAHEVEWGWSAPMFDFDNDGWVDIFAANGFTLPARWEGPLAYGHLPDRLFQNLGNWVRGARPHAGPSYDGPGFREVGGAAGVADTRDGRGAAYGDLDGDGDLDLVVSYHNSTPALYRNDGGNRNSWLRVQLEGSCQATTPRGANCSSHDAVGAKVRISAAQTPVRERPRAFTFDLPPELRTLPLPGREVEQVAEVKAGSGYLSQSERTLHFGLGRTDADTEIALEVRWPSGQVDRLPRVAPNQTVSLREGQGRQVWVRPASDPPPPPLDDEPPRDFSFQRGWHGGRRVHYLSFGPTPDVPAPVWFPIYRNGTHAIGGIGILDQVEEGIFRGVPTDPGYSDYWVEYFVVVPDDYVPNTLRSLEDIQRSGYPVYRGVKIGNCPVVPKNSLMPQPGDYLGFITPIPAWYKGVQTGYYLFETIHPEGSDRTVAVPDLFDPNTGKVKTAPAIALLLPDGGRELFYKYAPGEAGYSSLLNITLAKAPPGYTEGTLRSYDEVASRIASGEIRAEGVEPLMNTPFIEYVP